MSKKIFNSIWFVALAVLLASLVFIMGVTYSYFSGVQESQLRTETALAARGVALNGMDYFTDLGEKGYRITWIDGDGTVLYDSQAELSKMENHLEREEVKQALEPASEKAAAIPRRFRKSCCTQRSCCPTERWCAFRA